MFDTQIADRIFFLGTMHIDHASSVNVQKQIRNLKPDVVMVELDPYRYQELRKRSQIPTNALVKNGLPDSLKEAADHQGMGNLDLLDRMQVFQLEMGQMFGVMPGKEMLAAIDAAEAFNIPVQFIDRPIQETFERIQALGDRISKEQESLVGSMEKDQLSQADIQDMVEDIKDPQNVRNIINNFKKDYPELYKILIEERNEYMAEKIIAYSNKNPNSRVVVVIGGGHVEELVQIITPKIE
jgi:pheromone shutdown protein TraB